ncbi:MAG: DNA repair protein RadC [Dehalococcoidales bacterium]|nr:DNA repair protein RadC [Dehalococcoidales bacterium]
MTEQNRVPAGESQHGHRKRLRERFLKSGLSGFPDYEIVELLLCLGTPRKDCKQPAKEAIKRFGTLRGVLEASGDELQAIEGIGPHNAFGIKLIQEVGREFLKARILDKPFVASSQEVFDYLYHSMRGLKKELFKVLHLDARNRIIDIVDLPEGTVNSSAVSVRNVIETAMQHHGVSLVFAHNHPSGKPEPSLNDKKLTREMVHAARLIQLKVLDHIIIGDNRFYSFAGEGLIEEYEADVVDMMIKGTAEIRKKHYKV